jgi:hypothetical protein
LNGTHQLLVYADYVNALGGGLHTTGNIESLVMASNEIRPEVNVDTTQYKVISRDRNAGQGHNMKINNSSFEKVKVLKYLGTTFINENHIEEEIGSRLKSGDACYHSVQNFVSWFPIQKYKD